MTSEITMMRASPGRRPGPRPTTSRQAIAQSALRMLEREGPEALTFRAVARELGLTVGALARYFKSLSDLQDEISAAIFSAVRPLQARSKRTLRQQLVGLGMELLALHRAHPYLLKQQGPLTAARVARHSRQCLEVMLALGIDFDRAMAIYALVGNLPYAWGVQEARQPAPEVQAQIVKAYFDELGELAPRMRKLFGAGESSGVYQRWLALYVDGLLADQSVPGEKRSRQ
jgi:AcrR family transcriptional regulator